MSENRRHAYRIPVTAGNQAAHLRSDRVHLPVRLVDESATGFLLATDGDVPIAKNDILKLQTYAGWMEVEIAAYLSKMEKRGSA